MWAIIHSMSATIRAMCLAVVIGLGCKGSAGSGTRAEPPDAATTTTTATASATVVKPPPMPRNLPDPAACQHDDDCEVSLTFDATGCCNQNFDGPMSKAFRSAVDTWAKTACAGYVCPRQPYPGPRPAACFYEPRCIARRCGNACSAPDPGF